MKLPTPCGRMTVTFGLDKKVRVPVWDEEALKQALSAEREACAQLCDAEASIEGIAQRCAAAIRNRSKE